MNSSSLLYILLFVFRLLWRQILQTLLIIITLSSLITNLNIVTINLTILTWVLSFKLVKEASDNDKPILYDWIKTIILSVVVTSFFVLLFIFFGGYGLLGLIIVMFLMATHVIYNNWRLFDKATTWGAERVKGLHNENFNFEEALKENKK